MTAILSPPYQLTPPSTSSNSYEEAMSTGGDERRYAVGAYVKRLVDAPQRGGRLFAREEFLGFGSESVRR